MSSEMYFNQFATKVVDRTNVIDLATGYPVYGPPPGLRGTLDSEMVRSVLECDHPYGLPELREAIAEETFKDTGIAFDPSSEITVTGSASEAISVAVLAVVNPRERVVIFSPHFPTYPGAVHAAKGVSHFVAMDSKGQVDLAALAESLRLGAKAVIVNTPHNPSGSILGACAVQAIADMCYKSNATLISDEVFAQTVRRGVHISPCSPKAARERAILVGDSGKRFDLGGFRIGFLAATAELSSRLRSIQQLFTYRVPAALQRTVARCITVAASTDYYNRLSDQFDKNALILIEAFKAIRSDTSCELPPAGPFLTLSVRRHRSSSAVADFLLARAGVAVLPNVAFYAGADSNEGNNFIRLSLARPTSVVRRAASRIERALLVDWWSADGV